jgi:hypothetical protein
MFILFQMAVLEMFQLICHNLSSSAAYFLPFVMHSLKGEYASMQSFKSAGWIQFVLHCFQIIAHFKANTAPGLMNFMFILFQMAVLEMFQLICHNLSKNPIMDIK